MKAIMNICENLKRNTIFYFVLAVLFFSPFNSHLSAQWNLPNDFAQDIDAAITMSDGSIYFFKGSGIAVYGEPQQKELSSIANWPASWPSITAAVTWDAQTVFLFSGNSYLTMDLNTVEITGGDIWPGLPAHWQDQIDAAIDWSDDELYFFFGNEFVAYNKTNQTYSAPSSLSTWGLPGNWSSIDAVLNGGEGSIYFFNASQFSIYDQNAGTFSEPTAINEGGISQGGSIPSPGQRTVTNSKSPVRSASSPGARPIETEEDTYEEETYEEEIDDEDPALALRPTTPFPDEYRDDYKAFTSRLMNITWGAATTGSLRALASKNWVGAGVDILTIDPMQVSKSKRPTKTAILMTDSDVVAGISSEFIIPFGTKLETINHAYTKEGKKLLKTFGDFSTEFGGSIGGSVEVPGIASGSASASYKQRNKSSFGTETIYGYKQAYNELYKVSMSLDWIDNITHQKYRQKLDKGFRNMVGNLKVPSTMPSIILPSKKGDKLPSSLNGVKTSYKSMQKAYGTHITQSVTFGGRFISLYEINRSSYESSRMTEAGFEAAASASIKGISIGMNASFEYKDERTSGTSSDDFNQTSYVSGGSATTFEKWEDKITTAPAPIEVELLPLYKLLNKKYFPNDPDIEKKAEILKAVMLEYVCTNMNLPEDVDLENDNFFKALAPIEYNYEVTITHLKCTKVSGGEPGSENEFFGDMTFTHNGESKKVWDKDEDSTISLQQDAEMPIRIRDPYIITLAKGKKGVVDITANLFEEDTSYGAFGGDDDNLGTETLKIDLTEIGNEPVIKYLEFSHDGDEAEFKISINRTMKVVSY